MTINIIHLNLYKHNIVLIVNINTNAVCKLWLKMSKITTKLV